MGERAVDTVRRAIASYLEQDRAAAEALFPDDFTFTTPLDDHVDRETFFRRCFPTAQRFWRLELLHLEETDGGHVLAVYEYALHDGSCYRNAERYLVRDGQIHEVEVYFGGSVREIDLTRRGSPAPRRSAASRG